MTSRDELDRIATTNDEDLRPLQGWRRELFGNDALEMKAGRLGLTGDRGQVRVLTPDELD
jgi:ribonuclease D